MNAPNKSLMLLDGMAAKYGLRVEEFSATVRATCGMPGASPEEFAAFISVCREYGLNPLLRQIYAYPKRGGGLIPVVGIDGWIHLVTTHPMANGFDFTIHRNDRDELVSITCYMHRRDWANPVVVNEPLAECIRPTEPWKQHPQRMLRHKALVQAARYAFGFSGIYDPDEAHDIAEMKDITPPPAPPKPPASGLKHTQFAETAKKNAPPVPPKPPVKPERKPESDFEREEPLPSTLREPEQEIINGDTGEIQTPGDLLSELDDALGTAKNISDLETIWNDYDLEARLEEMPSGEEFFSVAWGIKRKHIKRVGK